MRILAFALTLLTAACAAVTPVEPRVTAALDQPFTLRVGQTATFGSDPGELRFEGVVEDSRCPIGVTCVWEGNARIRLHLGSGQASRLVELNTGVEPRAAAELGYRIELLALDPQPEQGRSLRPDHYRATLRVTRAP